MSLVEPGSFRGRWSRLVSIAAIPLMALGAVTMLIGARSSPMQHGYGAFGPESPRMREQLWILPGANPKVPLRATLFRPVDDDGLLKRPLVVINHGTNEDTRLAVSMPVYYWLSAWFVDRGYAVLLPQRRGHGATGGLLAEAVGDCDAPEHFRAGQIAADDVQSAIRFMQQQPFIDASNILVAGISSGGWASLALAARNPDGVRGVINFAGGRGGHAFGRANAVCGEEELIQAAGDFAKTARVPSLWLYAENDSYFGPELAQKLAQTWNENGGFAELKVLPPYGREGHVMPEDRAGWDLWGASAEHFLVALGGEDGTHGATLVQDGVPDDGPERPHFIKTSQ